MEITPGNIYGTLPYVHDTTIGYQISVDASESNVSISNRSNNRSSWSAYVTLRYTKKIDSAS